MKLVLGMVWDLHIMPRQNQGLEKDMLKVQDLLLKVVILMLGNLGLAKKLIVRNTGFFSFLLITFRTQFN